MPCCEVHEYLWIKLRSQGPASHGLTSLSVTQAAAGTSWLSLVSYYRTQLPTKFPLLWNSLVRPSLIFLMALMVKNPPAYAGDVRDMASISRSERSPGGGYGNPFQYSWLENPMDRGAWQATVHRVTKSWTQLKQLSTQVHTILY